MTNHTLRFVLSLVSLAVFVAGPVSAQDSTWTTNAPLPTGRFGAPAAVIDGKLYVAGGCCVTQFSPFTRYTVLEVYDPATDSWSTGASIPTGIYAAAVGAIGGKLYVAGGQAASANIATLQVYDPATNTWTTGASMNSSGAGAAAGVIAGKLYVAAGMNASNTATIATLRIYDPGSNTWTTGASLSKPRVFPGGAVVNGKLYVVGGYDNGVTFSTVEMYDPQTNTWTTKAPMPTPRYGMALQEIGGVLYAAGGWDGGPLNIVEVYDPATDTWTTADPLPTARSLPASGVIDGVLHVIGGAGAAGPDGAQALITANEAFTPTVSNLAPTADAGLDQSLHAGETVFLNGGSSFDDNTPSSGLGFSWSFASQPEGSTAVLNGANTATPNFIPDLPGTYVVQLIVTDEAGLASTPDNVVISSTNQAPTANAGMDQLVILSSVVSLSGAGFDPDGDSVSFAWMLTTRPPGSSAELTNANTATPTFAPDIPGLYVAELVVGDGFSDSAPDAVQITAVTAADYSQTQIQSSADVVEALPATSVTAAGNQQSLMNFLSQAVQFIQSGGLEQARLKLELAIARTDGCAVGGVPDGNGLSRDWITTCDAQDQIYPLLIAALAALTP